MIGGGDVSPFAGIFSILTIFMVAAAVGLIVGVVIMIVLAVKNRASQNNMIQTMPMKRFCICLVAGSVSSFLVSGCLSMLPTAMSSVVGVIIFFLVIAAYSALLFFLIYKPLEAKVGKSYALVGGSDFLLRLLHWEWACPHVYGGARYFKKDMREFLIYIPFKSP